MVIVYLSVLIVVGSLVYLAISAVRTFKATKPILQDVTDTTARIQAKTDTIMQEKDRLMLNQQQFTEDIQEKKEVVMAVVEKAKETPEPIKQFWKEAKRKPVTANSRQ
ncbi:DUF948 domain-containing protein [Peribacillus saganii]|uniref:DUF948 domain-containing protein n=1 Tax=Peribacillus saganii TaxID=2303992 RepID=A0A372LPM2_9BACI|nr:DUF948 domain-containing protein [Peribacillus saganii]RFU70064.1 DUF948 domain-containing protein [Peribacillus saganii]